MSHPTESSRPLDLGHGLRLQNFEMDQSAATGADKGSFAPIPESYRP